jgi:phage terminase large subunit-like protein
VAPEGDFWKKEWFITTYDELPAFVHNVGWDWDLAYTKDEANSASAGIKSGRGPGKRDEFIIYVDDVDWDWLEFPDLIPFMKEKDGPHYIEDKASGKSAKQSLQREGVMALTVAVKGDKLARASNVQPVVSNGRIAVRKAVLHQLLAGSRQGLLNVRTDDLVSGKGDLDLNDTFVQMITRHVGDGDRRRFAFTPGQTGDKNGKENGAKKSGSRHVNGARR